MRKTLRGSRLRFYGGRGSVCLHSKGRGPRGGPAKYCSGVINLSGDCLSYHFRSVPDRKSIRSSDVILGAQDNFTLSWTLVFLLVIQLSLGAVLRHTGRLLILHIGLATVLLLLAMFVGIRTWALHQDEPILRRLGVALLTVVGLQALLGVGAVIATDGGHVLAHPLFWQAMVTTTHQFCGAVLLATALMVALWTLRFQTKPRRSLG